MKLKFYSAIFLSLVLPDLTAAQRAAWTTSRLTGSPEKPPKYKLERHFPGLRLTNAVDIAWNETLQRWFVAEQGGRVITFDSNGSNVHQAADFSPLQGHEGALYAITFDPGFATNRFVYACYVLKSEIPDGSHVSRFVVRDEPEPAIDLKSEALIITWLSGGHNGCCLKFGKDGFLYISTGDGAGPNPPDPRRTGQDNSDLLSCVLRIDVHHKSEGRNYQVPGDNPFVNVPGSRPEIWAFGFRNPWRMGFDAQTGDLWVADVGWELWELVYRVKKGGNYGWSIVEGRQPVIPSQTRGPGEIIPPVKDHPHSEAASITGGIVYYGAKFPELRGAFLYGDWETGKIWGLRADASDKPTFSEELLDSTVRVVAFAPDSHGETMVLDYNGGLYSLERNVPVSRPEDFPTRLSQTGLFRSTPDHLPATGVVPFQINAAFWNDFATGERFIALPGESQVNSTERPWRYPSNAVLVRTVSMEMVRGEPSTKRRLETQILHFNGDGWAAYTYRWNRDQTDADLVPAEGAEELLRVKDPAEPGGVRVQAWRYHSRTECLRCHNPWCGTALAFQPEQLSRNSGKDNQIEALAAAGILRSAPREKIVAHVSPYDHGAELNARARSYLHINCSHCHRDGAGGSVPSFMSADLPLEKMHLVAAKPIRGDLGLKDARVVAPGAPFSSVLLFRTSSTGRSRMPYLGSHLVDEDGITLLREWIESLGPGKAQDDAAALRNELTRSPAGAESIANRYAAASSGALELAHVLTDPAVAAGIRETVARSACRSSNPLVRELFERFLPPDARAPVSTAIPSKTEVLALKGDARRGAMLLNDSGRVACLQCHQFQNSGRLFGPPFKQAAKGKSREEILVNILEPSRQIAPEYVFYTADLADDESLSGIIIQKDSDGVVLRDAGGVDHRLPAASIKSLKPQQLSAMPEGLLAGFSAQEVADLLEAIAAEAAQ